MVEPFEFAWFVEALLRELLRERRILGLESLLTSLPFESLLAILLFESLRLMTLTRELDL